MHTAIVPLKDLVQAKSRLAGLLAPAERRELAQAMAEDVLAVLAQHPLVEATVLVSDDPAAAMIADYYGARWQQERTLGCRGLNAVLNCVCNNLQIAEDAGILVLHADLPWLACEDLDAVFAACAGQTLVLGTDRHGTGTNLLAFSAAHHPRFRFGADSRRLHESGALERGRPVQVLQRAGIALDVDEPADLACLLAQPERLHSRRTGEALFGTGLAARIELTLASLEVNETAAAGAAVDGETAQP